ncbi:MAG: type II secretion system protein [Candidatus Komeilibacteria bacterium]
MKKGFTLIELLVVIAIIGILSSIAIVNLNSARQRAQTAQAQGSLSSLAAIVVLCLDGNGNLNCSDTATPSACVRSTSDIPTSGNALCVGATPGPGNTWPTLQGTWQLRYALSNQSEGRFHYYASEGGDDPAAGDDGFACDESGCRQDVFPMVVDDIPANT